MTVPSNGGPVTPRELYPHLEAIRASLGSQIKDVQTTVENKLGEMRSDMATSQKQHEQEHQRDRDRRSALFRWAVTTLVSVGLLITAIYVSAKGGG